MGKMSEKDFHEALHAIFEHVMDTGGIEEMQARLIRVEQMEEAIHQAINEQNQEKDEPGVTMVALMNVLAQHIVIRAIQEPPEVPAPVLSLEAVKNGLKMATEALASFAASAIRDAEANGCTIAMRFRPKRAEDPEGATETAPSTAPGASGPLRDASGATDTDPTTETSFGGSKASGTEG